MFIAIKQYRTTTRLKTHNWFYDSINKRRRLHLDRKCNQCLTYHDSNGKSPGCILPFRKLTKIRVDLKDSKKPMFSKYRIKQYFKNNRLISM